MERLSNHDEATLQIIRLHIDRLKDQLIRKHGKQIAKKWAPRPRKRFDIFDV